MSFLDLRVQLWHALIVERNFSANQNVKDYTKTPDIDLRTSVLLCLQKLRCRKVKTTTESLQLATGGEKVAEAKIDNFDIARLADEDIFNLQISVNNAVAVAIVESACDLASKLASLLLLQPSMRDDVIQHLATIDVFAKHVPVVVRPDDIAHPADVRMIC